MQTPTRQQIPLAFLADMSFVKGPPVVKSEQSARTPGSTWTSRTVDIGSYVENAQAAVAAEVEIPTGYSLGLERAVRVPAPRPRAHGDHDSAHPAAHSAHDPDEHPLAVPDAHRGDGGAPSPSWARLAPLRARLQPEHRGGGGDHRPRRAERRDRGGDAALSGPLLRSGPGSGTPHEPRRTRRGGLRPGPSGG